MKRFVLPLIAIALSACPAFASELSSARVAKLAKHVQFEPQTGVQENEIAIQAIPQPMPPHRPLHVRLAEIVECPIKPLVEYLGSPNSQLRRLFSESEDLRRAREQFQRFWTINSRAF
jgi:hypothetical protein